MKKKDDLPTPIHRVTWLPSGDLLFVEDFRGSQNLPERPECLECDACCQRVDRLWVYPTRPFCHIMQHRRGLECEQSSWNFCVMCRPLFEAREFKTLAARVEVFLPLPSEYLVSLYETVYAVRSNGDVLTWEAGRLWPGLMLKKS